MAEVPQLAFPLRIDPATGDFAVVEQDSLDDVRQCVYTLMLTPLGVRPLAPDIGVEDPTFSAGVDPDALAATLEEQEPRATVTVTANPVAGTGEQQITVEVGLASEDDEELE